MIDIYCIVAFFLGVGLTFAFFYGIVKYKLSTYNKARNEYRALVEKQKALLETIEIYKKNMRKSNITARH